VDLAASPTAVEDPVPNGDTADAAAGPEASEGPAPLPLRAGLAVLVGFAATLAAGSVLLRLTRGAPVATFVSAVAIVTGQYLAMFGLCVAVCRRWATGSWRRDLGFRLSLRDVREGVTGWVLGMGVIGLITMVLRHAGVPTSSNNPLTASSGTPAVSLPQWAAVVTAGIVMVAVAPVFEELLFRGILQRSLCSRFPVGVALAVQALAFGLFHFDARRGMGNAGLLVVLSGVGLVLGVIAQRNGGRLGAPMVAHSLHNCLAFAVGVAALL
jgi:membrane protease YdiL (CAAX protease family)